MTLLDDAAAKVVIFQEEEIGATVAEARARWAGSARWLQHDAPGGARGPTRRSWPPASTRPTPGSRSTPPAGAPALHRGLRRLPNGAQLAHQAILAQDLVVAMVQRITEETVYLNSGPMFHMATLMTTFATFRMGGTNVLTRRVDAEELCRIIEAERCNYGFVMGPTAAEILEVNKDGRYDLSSLRTFGGGEPGTPWSRWTTAPGGPTRPATARPRSRAC